MIFNTFALLNTFLKNFVGVRGDHKLLVGSDYQGCDP